MRAGLLRHEALIEKPDNLSTELDTRGQQQTSWGRVAKVRCSLEPLRGNEAFQVRQQFATATHLVRFRYIENITPICRIVSRGRTFQVNEVRNVNERDDVIELVCTEEV